jgi:hypothetical protein
MDKAKIRLSANEMELVTNAAWILTKNGIIEKTKTLFSQIQEKMIDHLKSVDAQFTIDVTRVSPKISKGENYKGLPYLMLDYPRLFDKENIFAVRTMFWWGNFFSITLHLGGNYKNQFEEKCISALPVFKPHDFFVCIHTEEWEHHFDPSNYTAIKDLDSFQWEKIIKEKSFIKIAKKYSLHQWDDADNKLSDDFTLITGVLAF